MYHLLHLFKYVLCQFKFSGAYFVLFFQVRLMCIFFKKRYSNIYSMVCTLSLSSRESFWILTFFCILNFSAAGCTFDMYILLTLSSCFGDDFFFQDTKLLQALVENRKRSIPYAGAFLLKDEPGSDGSESESNINDLKGKELLKRLHDVGTLAQAWILTCPFTFFNMKHIAFFWRNIKRTQILLFIYKFELFFSDNQYPRGTSGADWAQEVTNNWHCKLIGLV